MKPTDEAYKAAALAIRENGPYYAGSKIRESMAKYIAEIAINAAFAAQFKPVEEYAELVKQLRSIDEAEWLDNWENSYDLEPKSFEVLCEKAADAIEVLCERLSGVHAPSAMWDDGRHAPTPSAIPSGSVNAGFTIKNAAFDDKGQMLSGEICHSTAPVDDEALEKLVYEAILKSMAERNCTIAGVPFNKDNWTEYDASEAIDHTRAALSVARPVIKAAEREMCLEIARRHQREWHGGDDGCARANIKEIGRGE